MQPLSFEFSKGGSLSYLCVAKYNQPTKLGCPQIPENFNFWCLKLTSTQNTKKLRGCLGATNQTSSGKHIAAQKSGTNLCAPLDGNKSQNLRNLSSVILSHIYGHGSKSYPSEHPNPTTKIKPKMGGEFTYQPKWYPTRF